MIKIILFLFAFSTLIAEETQVPDSQLLPLANLDGEPTAIVNQAVNVITGNYCDAQVDLVISGPRPLLFERAYTSSDYGKGTLFNSWNMNHQGKIEGYIADKVLTSDDPTHNKIVFTDSFGSQRAFRAKVSENRKKLNKYKLRSYCLKKGVTNTASGEISGRTNLKNTHFFHLPYSSNYFVETGSGEKRYFSNLQGIVNQLYQTKTVYPNGHQIIYKYTDPKEGRDFFLKEINLCNSKNEIFSKLKIECHHEGAFKESPKMIIRAGDGREVNYRFTRFKNNKTDREGVYLTQVKRPNDPDEYYTYEQNSHRIIRKERPEERFLEIEYYKKGLSKKDFSYRRVKSLFAPTGTNQEPIKTHQFFYKEGSTSVLDALNNQTIYRYSKDFRLTDVERYTASEELYSKEQLFWGKTGSRDETHLITRVLKDKNDQIAFCRHFEYDDQRNIITDSLYGNLTGQNQGTLTIGTYGSIINENCEVYTKRYTYNKLNLVLTETDFRKTLAYAYHEGTDLLHKKFTKEKNSIKKRSFYHYDENAVLVLEINDDGCSEDEKDLTGVTERHIKKITPQDCYPFGLPQVIEECYLDLKTGKEVSLKKTLFSYSKEGRILKKKIFDANDAPISKESYDYDSLGNQTLYVNALGEKTERIFDANSNLVYEQGPNLNYQKKFTYDFSNRLIREEIIQKNGKRFTTSYKYDLVGNRIETVDMYGNVTKTSYDAFRRPIVSENPLSIQTFTEYDLMSRPTSISIGNEKVTKTTYNLHGNPILVQHADGTVERNIYSLDGLLMESISRNGLITRYTYDYEGRVLTKRMYSVNGEYLSGTVSTYNAFHQISEKDAEGNLSLHSYDGAGRLIETRNGNSRTTYHYNAQGKLSEQHSYFSEENYAIKKFTYDLLGRIVEEKILDQNGEILRQNKSTFDVDGNLIQSTDGKKVTKFEYNVFNEVIKTTDALGQCTTIKNHYGSTLTRETFDPNGKNTHILFDALGNISVLQVKSPLNEILQKSEFTYDSYGNCTGQKETVFSRGKEQKVIITCWKYDLSNREIEKIEAAGTSEQKITRTFYNHLGQKEEVIKPDGVILFHEYDAFGLLKRFNASDNSFDYYFTYNKNQLPISVVDQISGRESLYTYDGNGNLLQETLGNGLTLYYTYDGLNRPTSITLPDASTIEYTYNGTDLKQVQYGDLNFEYTYDLNGNPLKLGKINHTYDLLGRVSSIQSSSWKSDQHIYDKAGNLLHRTVEDSEGSYECNYSYDLLSQVIKEEGHQYTYDSIHNRIEKDGSTYEFNSLNQRVGSAYDLNGCLIKNEDIAFTYDALNRLCEVNKNDQKIKYSYDEKNRRLSKSIFYKSGDNWVLEKESFFIYTGNNEIGKVENGSIAQLRILGVGKGAEIGAAIALKLEGEIHFPIHDHNGNLVGLEGVESYRLTAFGEENFETTPLSPWRYSSKRHDEETGFIYFGSRYYDPKEGRWITPDPKGFEDGPNLYAFVHNNPLTNFDLYGLTTQGGHSFLCMALSYIGQGIQFIGEHFLPVPVIRDGVAYAGYALNPQRQNQFKPSSKQPHSNNYYLSGNDVTLAETNMSVNGINTPYDNTHDRNHDMSKVFGGSSFHFTFNATHGILSDLLECVAQHLGIRTRSVDCCVALIKERIAAVGGPGNGGRVNVHAHSQGGLILYRALEQLTAEERKMLHVVTYGSAKIISAEGLGSAVNYINTQDWIPYLSDVMGIVKGSNNPNYDIRYLESPAGTFFDHSFEKSAYWEVFLEAGKDFQRRHRSQ